MQDILEIMDKAFKEDRLRFLRATDYVQNSTGFTQEQKTEIERLRQWFRDAPELEGYPNIEHPIQLPAYCPNPHFASRWAKDELLQGG